MEQGLCVNDAWCASCARARSACALILTLGTRKGWRFRNGGHARVRPQRAAVLHCCVTSNLGAVRRLVHSQIAPLLAMSSSGTGTQTAGAQMACKTVAWFRIRLNLIGYTTVNPTVVLLARPGCVASAGARSRSRILRRRRSRSGAPGASILRPGAAASRACSNRDISVAAPAAMN